MSWALDKAVIVKKANEVLRTLTGEFEPIRRLVDTHELVIAVWQDIQEPDGVGTMIVKGRGALATIAMGSEAKELAWTAIPCACAEQAAALRQATPHLQALN